MQRRRDSEGRNRGSLGGTDAFLEGLVHRLPSAPASGQARRKIYGRPFMQIANNEGETADVRWRDGLPIPPRLLAALSSSSLEFEGLSIFRYRSPFLTSSACVVLATFSRKRVITEYWIEKKPQKPLIITLVNCQGPHVQCLHGVESKEHEPREIMKNIVVGLLLFF